MDKEQNCKGKESCEKGDCQGCGAIADAIFGGLVTIADAIRYHADRTGEPVTQDGESYFVGDGEAFYLDGTRK